jgi:hypothetical protein
MSSNRPQEIHQALTVLHTQGDGLAAHQMLILRNSPFNPMAVPHQSIITVYLPHHQYSTPVPPTQMETRFYQCQEAHLHITTTTSIKPVVTLAPRVVGVQTVLGLPVL